MKPYSDSEIRSIDRSLEDGIEPQRGGIDPYDLPRWLATYDALSARVAKLEAALRFYAEPDVYIFRETTDDGGITPVLVINDGGAKARAALEEFCKGDSPEAAEEDKS